MVANISCSLKCTSEGLKMAQVTCVDHPAVKQSQDLHSWIYRSSLWGAVCCFCATIWLVFDWCFWATAKFLVFHIYFPKLHVRSILLTFFPGCTRSRCRRTPLDVADDDQAASAHATEARRAKMPQLPQIFLLNICWQNCRYLIFA